MNKNHLLDLLRVPPEDRKRVTLGTVYALTYLATIILSAALVEYVGIVPVGFGLVAPAGAYVIGITMVFRDLTQDQLGPWWTYSALVLGTILSALVSPAIAFAAAAAFLISETLDQLVYTPIRKVSLVWAVLASNTVGIIADSIIFVGLAFGSLDYAPGQMWAKALATIGCLVILKILYRNRTTMRPAYLIARDTKRYNLTPTGAH